MCISEISLGQARRTLCKGRSGRRRRSWRRLQHLIFQRRNRGQFFCFNCEGVGHVEFECPHPRIERSDTEEEKSNEEEDENLKKLNHVEIENSKLKDTRRKLRSQLVVKR